MEEVKSAIKYRQQDPSGSDTIPQSTSKPPSLKKEDYPAIKFWRQRDYTQLQVLSIENEVLITLFFGLNHGKKGDRYRCGISRQQLIK